MPQNDVEVKLVHTVILYLNVAFTDKWLVVETSFYDWTHVYFYFYFANF